MDDWTNGPAPGERLRPISLTQTRALKMKGHSDGPPPTSPGGCKPGREGGAAIGFPVPLVGLEQTLWRPRKEVQV